VKALDQGLGVRIGIGIESQMRMAVAAQKALQPQHVGMPGSSDDHRAAGAGFEEADAAQDQRAHDALAEFRLGDQQRAQSIGLDDQRLDGPARNGVDQGRPAGKLRELAQEGAGSMGDDRCGSAGRVVAADVDLAREDDAEAAASIADLGE
jgi:hypothetical protein